MCSVSLPSSPRPLVLLEHPHIIFIDCHMLATVRGSPGVFWNLRDLKLAEITTVGITSLSQK